MVNDILKYKARLVAQGFTQAYGIDYDETFAAVATSATFRALLAKASKDNLKIKQFDVASAFLNGHLNEDIYMKTPPGFEEGDFVLKLNKSLYGLKQAAKVWFDTLSKALLEIGFKQSHSDKCLYIFKSEEGICYLMCHVDDLLFVGTSNSIIDKLSTLLGTHFEIKDLGQIKHFLGIDVIKENGVYSICQQAYIEKIAESFELSDIKPQTIPMNVSYYKLDHNKLLPNNTEYRRLLGMLLYVATSSRPDIAAPVNILAQKTVNPSEWDFSELKHILAFLLKTKSHRLSMFSSEFKDIPLTAYSDANWAEDRETRKSLSGILCLVHGGAVVWTSRKQTRVSQSSTESEYYAVGDAIKELIWLKQLLMDIDIDTSRTTTLNCDNQSCIKLITNDKLSRRSKYFDTSYKFIKEAVENKIVELSYVPTEHNIADILTKPLNKNRLDYLRKLLHFDFSNVS